MAFTFLEGWEKNQRRIFYNVGELHDIYFHNIKSIDNPFLWLCHARLLTLLLMTAVPLARQACNKMWQTYSPQSQKIFTISSFKEKVGFPVLQYTAQDTSSHLWIQLSPLCTNSHAGRKKKEGVINGSPHCSTLCSPATQLSSSADGPANKPYTDRKHSTSIKKVTGNMIVNEISHINCETLFISVCIFPEVVKKNQVFLRCGIKTYKIYDYWEDKINFLPMKLEEITDSLRAPHLAQSLSYCRPIIETQ